MNQTNTHNNIIYAYSKMPREVISCWEIHGACPQSCADMPRTMGHVRTRTYFYILSNICFSGGNYTLITCIQYTTMVTHSECEISQSWRTQFSSHGALNLNRAVMPPPFPYNDFVLSWCNNATTSRHQRRQCVGDSWRYSLDRESGILPLSHWASIMYIYYYIPIRAPWWCIQLK